MQDKEKRPVIETFHLSTGYRHHGKETVVSRDVNETLYNGELTCLLGRNGSGKSTILKTLSGFIPPLGGSIEIAGKKLSDYSPAQMSKVIGVVLTERLTMANMTVRELVETGRSPYTGYWGRLGKEDKRIVEEAMEAVNIISLADRQVITLSDGERQKSLIAKALAQETPVIFLDEPTAFLDYPSKAETLILLRNLARERQRTVFLSTHDIEVALRIADKLWLLDKENGIVTGTPDSLSRDGEIGRFFDTDGMKYDPHTRTFEL